MSGKQRNIRKRRALDEEEGEEGGEGEQAPSLEDTKLLQKARQRRTVSAAGCGRAPGLVAALQAAVTARRRLQSLSSCRTTDWPAPAGTQGIEAGTLAVADRAPQLGAGAGAGGPGGPDVLEAAFKKEKRRVASEEDPHM